MTHFPLFMELSGREILILGGGDHALQRAKKLLPFCKGITVISEKISDEIKNLQGITVKERAFLLEDLDSRPAFVVAAEGREQNAFIYSVCQKKGIPVNSVDMPEYCDIIFPAIISTDHLCVGVSSEGISPTAAIVFRDRIEALIPENIDEILEWMPSAKAYIRKNAPAELQNKLLKRAFCLALDEGGVLLEDRLSRIIEDTK